MKLLNSNHILRSMNSSLLSADLSATSSDFSTLDISTASIEELSAVIVEEMMSVVKEDLALLITEGED